MRRLPQSEFIALLALLWASLAFAMDSMLPAFPEIAAVLSPDDPNKAQLVLTSFVLGMGVGLIFFGPISDRFGRKPVLLFGLGLYAAGALLAVYSNSLEMLLLSRVIQGIGAASTRVVSTALVRDLYVGREMARITSIVMTIFLIVPAAAPAIGQGIIAVFGWRSIFISFVIFAAITAAWLGFRQPETLPKENRRALSLSTLWVGTKDIYARKTMVIYTLVLALGFGQMFALLSTIQPIYDGIFGKAQSFPIWFALGAFIALIGTLINTKFVTHIGMRPIATYAYMGQIVISGLVMIVTSLNLTPEPLEFTVFYIWSVSIFFMAGLTFGNLMALALEPLGHLAGLASSLVQGLSTIGAVLIAVPIGLAYNGSILPVVVGSFICSALSYVLMRGTRDAAPVTEAA